MQLFENVRSGVGFSGESPKMFRSNKLRSFPLWGLVLWSAVGPKGEWKAESLGARSACKKDAEREAAARGSDSSLGRFWRFCLFARRAPDERESRPNRASDCTQLARAIRSSSLLHEQNFDCAAQRTSSQARPPPTLRRWHQSAGSEACRCWHQRTQSKVSKDAGRVWILQSGSRPGWDRASEAGEAGEAGRRAGGHLQQLSMWQVAGSLRQRVHVKCVFQPTFSPLFPAPSPSPSRRLATVEKKSRTHEEASCGTAKLVALHARRAPRSIAPPAA
jgi:hypothetical protein